MNSYFLKFDPRLSIIVLVLGTLLIVIGTIELLFTIFLINLILFILTPRHSLKILTFTSLFLFVFFSIFFLIRIFTFEQSLLALLRIININLIFSWFYLNLTPETLVKTLNWFKMPYSWAWTISASFRFIDLFIEETQDIVISLLLRRISLDSNIFQRVKLLPSIIFPLIVRVQVRSTQLTEALYIRNWNPERKRKNLFTQDEHSKRANLISIIYISFNLLLLFYFIGL